MHPFPAEFLVRLEEGPTEVACAVCRTGVLLVLKVSGRDRPDLVCSWCGEVLQNSQSAGETPRSGEPDNLRRRAIKLPLEQPRPGVE
ncbi:hypothetical protein [Nannocystis sp. SCPEA4]|uniref:hypothetical protein n=1 Tax=Nannocystis sp. SCPEA4 TaxID=2996787 RepID=UPI00226DBE4C|nr:hypothetical protein [Nannocystis sp. SCPEA4]MCY1061514.1 hypothetical protein [Nannocystis sp. SCPEA4]